MPSNELDTTTPQRLDEQRLDELRRAVDSALDDSTRSVEGCPQRLTDALRYSALAPGKRMRPILALLACELVSGNWRPAVPVACAVELVHVYSLIHDDLPAMDNDDLRRGLPTCHKKFDEATAILAGDSLQMLAIELICSQMPADRALECCRILSRAAGRQWLVGGQSDDLAAEGRFGDQQGFSDPQAAFEHLKSIHARKTGALIEASLQLGGVAGGGDSDHLNRLSEYGRAIGLAFQIVDDCLDVESTSEQLGKMTRKDSTLGKLTYPGLLGIEASRELAVGLVRDAQEAVAVYEGRAAALQELAQFVVDRSN